MTQIIITREHMEGLEDSEVTECANRFAEKCRQSAKVTVVEAIQSGHALNIMKDRIAHGEWTKWLGANWDYDLRTAQTYMALANNAKRFVFEQPGSIREAMRLIAEEKAEQESDIAPRSERKTGQVEVVEPEEPDDDPTPDPPTQRKTAKGSEKKPESSKPKTPPITPEIIDEPNESFPEERTLSDWSEQQILDFLVATADEPKPRAKRLRKTADRLDPPGDDQIPTRVQLINAIPEAWSDSLKQAATDWAAYKQARKKDDRIQSLRAWQIALKQMTDQSESIVVHKINNAIANSYKGWNHDTGNGSGSGRNSAATQDRGSCLGANGRPEIKPRKINYK